MEETTMRVYKFSDEELKKALKIYGDIRYIHYSQYGDGGLRVETENTE